MSFQSGHALGSIGELLGNQILPYLVDLSKE